MVHFCVDLRAGDPRDKIFGLLGLMKTTITADYGKCTEEVYPAFCATWAKELGNLYFLSFAGTSLIGSSVMRVTLLGSRLGWKYHVELKINVNGALFLNPFQTSSIAPAVYPCIHCTFPVTS